jgi:predicted DNA-binding ribbon-helix-helix protein
LTGSPANRIELLPLNFGDILNEGRFNHVAVNGLQFGWHHHVMEFFPRKGGQNEIANSQHSIRLGGRATTISLEDAFCRHSNLSSALRLFVLQFYRSQMPDPLTYEGCLPARLQPRGRINEPPPRDSSDITDRPITRPERGGLTYVVVKLCGGHFRSGIARPWRRLPLSRSTLRSGVVCGSLSSPYSGNQSERCVR